MSRTEGRAVPARSRESGQAMVEFALTIVIFVLLVMGVLDFGRGIFMYNGLAQASREIARVTSVHPGNPIGTSSETDDVIATQEGIIHDLNVDPANDISCEDIDGDPVVTSCLTGNWVRVDLAIDFTPITPPLAFLVGTLSLESSSSLQITSQ